MAQIYCKLNIGPDDCFHFFSSQEGIRQTQYKFCFLCKVFQDNAELVFRFVVHEKVSLGRWKNKREKNFGHLYANKVETEPLARTTIVYSIRIIEGTHHVTSVWPKFAPHCEKMSSIVKLDPKAKLIQYKRNLDGVSNFLFSSRWL